MILGIVAEYNPFHNGHLYHLLKSKEEAKANNVIVVMGGNFTQRGGTSIVDKWTKAEMAIRNGADLVIELPTIYNISSAENFADGAVKLLDSLKIVDYISFGAETEDLNKLNIIANLLYEEPKQYKDFLGEALNKGISFPKAREEAVLNFLNDDSYKEFICEPNNILGIEYLKSLKKYKSNMKPICIKRKNVGHLTEDYTGEFANATLIRRLINAGKFKDVKKFTTPATYTILTEELRNGHFVSSIHQFENIIMYNLRNMPVEKIAELPDVNEGLEYAIKRAADSCNTIDDFINIVSSKRYTHTRIRRILLYCLLKITKKDMAISKKTMPYIRILGANENGKDLISKISKANPKLKIVTSVKRFLDGNFDKNLKIMIEKDINATNIYTLGYENDSCSNLDFTKNINFERK